jgi:predicted MFS family arabinose efflux permease
MKVDDKTGISFATVILFATACGIVVGNIYYSQPLVGLISPALHISKLRASLMVSVTQLGYAAGLLLLVPLGDILENRRLVVVTIATSVPALLAAGLAGNGTVFLLASLCIGLTSVAVQMLVPLAAHLAPDATRGRVVGNVLSGLLFGILFARPVSSLITSLSSWRMVFFLSAGAMAGLVVILRLTLPYRQPESGQHYGALLLSIIKLPFTTPVLRNRAAYQCASFACFSLYWTAIPLLLASDFHYTQRGIALFALVGAAGALAAPIAGRLADRGHGQPGTAFALATLAGGFALALAGAHWHSVVLLALAGVALDAAVQCNLVFGQRAIYQLNPAMRSRLNGVFMSVTFLGGALGSALTSPLLEQGGFTSVCGLGVALPLAALVWFAAAEQRK